MRLTDFKDLLSESVFTNAEKIIGMIPESDLFKIDDIRVSEYKTVVIDLNREDGDWEFEIEIGKNSFGYFSILYGMIADYEEELFMYEESYDKLKESINKHKFKL